jgi:hypothetical protein
MNLFSFYFRKRRSGTNPYSVRKKQEKVVIVRRKSVRDVMGTDCTVHVHMYTCMYTWVWGE